MSAHEHDGSGCLDCKCSASPMNSYPCTCPQGQRGEIESRNHDMDIVQMPLTYATRHSSETFGEMSVQKKGQTVSAEIHIHDEWTDMIDNGDFVVGYYPKPGFRVRKNYPTDESHIVRGEN